MVAGGDDVNAQLEEFFSDLRSDAKAPGRVLPVSDGEIHAVLFLQLGQAFMHDGAPRAAENVTNEENAQAMRSLHQARVSMVPRARSMDFLTAPIQPSARNRSYRRDSGRSPHPGAVSRGCACSRGSCRCAKPS